jgi:glycosyltransferase involved in cell wall biosynthesis
MKPRVLFVDEDQKRNGTTVSLEYLVNGFHAAGYEVFVLTWKIDPETRAGLMPAATVIDARSRWIRSIALRVHFAYTQSPFSRKGLGMIFKDVFKGPAGVAIVMNTIRRVKPDLVYANEYSVVQASVAARVCGIPAVVHIRSPLLTGKWGIRRWLASRAILAANDAVFAISKIEADQLRARGRKKEKVHVIGEFVPAPSSGSEDQNTCRKKFGLPSGRRVVTMLGGIMDIKGTIEFLRAGLSLSTGGNGAMFVVAGNTHLDGTAERGSYQDRCMEVVEQLRKRDGIVLLGNVSNPIDLIIASDVIVSPSTVSHFSRPMVEAWRNGKPVVATRTRHMEGLITDGVNGLLVEPGNEEALADAIGRLLGDCSLCAALAAAGEMKAAAEFDAEKNLRAILDVCGSLRGVKGPLRAEARRG